MMKLACVLIMRIASKATAAPPTSPIIDAIKTDFAFWNCPGFAPAK